MKKEDLKKIALTYFATGKHLMEILELLEAETEVCWEDLKEIVYDAKIEHKEKLIQLENKTND